MAFPGSKFGRVIGVGRNAAIYTAGIDVYLINITNFYSSSSVMDRVIPVTVWRYDSEQERLVVERSYVFSDHSVWTDSYSQVFSYVALFYSTISANSIQEFYRNTYAQESFSEVAFDKVVYAGWWGPQRPGRQWGTAATETGGSVSVQPLGRLPLVSALTFPQAESSRRYIFTGLQNYDDLFEDIALGGNINVPDSFKMLAQADFDSYPVGTGPYFSPEGVRIAKNVYGENSSLVLYLIDPDTLPDPDEL